MEKTKEEIVISFLKDVIRGTEWENLIFLAGGPVRDEIMGISPKDLDLMVNSGIDGGIKFSIWLANRLGNYKDGSNPVIFPRYGTSKLSLTNNKLNLPNIDLEFVAPRKEVYTPGSRNPNVSAGTLEDEAMRRDLTINSLLKNISTGEVLDISGKGIEDIKNGVIRTPLIPDITFEEDGLRLMRCIRFSAKYDFNIPPEIINSIKKNSSLIDNISKERIMDELNKILVSPNPDKGISLLQSTGLMSHIMNEFNEAVGMKQNDHHTEDVFGHTMSVLKNTPPDLKTRLMALFHDIGKVVTKTVSPEGSVHFIGHEMASEDIVKKVMTRLKYPNDMIDAVASGVRNHMRLKHGGDNASKISDKTLRKFTNAVGDNLTHILDLIHADNVAHSSDASMPNQIKIVRKRIDNLSSKIDNSNVKLPINGDDLLAMGWKQGPIFRKVFDAIQDAWYENPNITREEALQIADRIKMENNINEMKRIMFYK
jgi:tRNA nucleotidyltransferase/poly(A) polymerase